MTSTFLIFAAGCLMFAITTVASLWVGYLLLHRSWATQNPELTSEDDELSPLLARARRNGVAVTPSEPLS